MAKPDWGALQHQFLAEHAKTGISPKDWCAAQGLNYSSAKRYIKVTTYGANSQKKTANKSANSQKEKGGASKNGKVKKTSPTQAPTQNLQKRNRYADHALLRRRTPSSLATRTH
ncbi:TPA: hypothetical protein MFI05_002435 [Klebsiella pneumoniae]|nr:hypothetical protein [Klebsiella pneumoniae]HBW8088178.1 hypothetical protein [Klebsiella pneumoniae]